MKLFNTQTKTYPIVFHAPGCTRNTRLWHEMLNTFPVSLKPKKKKGLYTLVTWSTYNGKTALEYCAEAAGVKIIVLRCPQSEWNNIKKVDLLLEYLKTSRSKYIIGLDSIDVVFSQHPNEIIRRFQQYQEINPDCKLLYNAALRGWPTGLSAMKECDRFEKRIKNKNRHLNAGAWVGERKYIKEFYQKVKDLDREKVFAERYRTKEQPSVKYAAFPTESPKIQIDTHCTIFQHMLGEGHLQRMGETKIPAGKDLVYVDCGAHIGKTVLGYLNENPNVSRCYAFEPAEACMHSEFWETAKARYGEKLRIFDFAVSNRKGTANLFINPSKPASQSATIVNGKSTGNLDYSQPVQVKTIDLSAWLKKFIQPNDYVVLKMDIEGAEYDTLKKCICDDTLKIVSELLVEYHGSKLAEYPNYAQRETMIAKYCKANNILITVFDH